MRDREPQRVEDIEKQISYQEHNKLWDYAITSAGAIETYVLVSVINPEPSLLKAVIFFVPSMVAAGGFMMGLHRNDQIRYLSGLRNGILREAKRVATLNNPTDSR